MKMILLQLYVLICCQAAVADQLINLGSNVTINCDLDEKEVYWIIQKTPDPPTLIVRSDSPPASPHYFNKTFRSKYSVQFKHCLIINNVTADELGVYYCMNTDARPQFSNSSRIYITEADQQTECHNQTVLEFIEQYQTQYQITIIIIISSLFIVLIVFAAGRTDRLDKHNHDADLLTRVTFQPRDSKLIHAQ